MAGETEMLFQLPLGSSLVSLRPRWTVPRRSDPLRGYPGFLHAAVAGLGLVVVVPVGNRLVDFARRGNLRADASAPIL